ncbi:MAG: hypothetical protein HRT60_12850, partial [Dinoroseobacter sp.]|nr:hypothetical protein [Dinoroseobacter sp.]
VRDHNADPDDVDVLRFTDLNATDITMANANGDLRITVTSTGDVIAVTNWSLRYSGDNWGIERIEFADGTVWDIDDIEANAWIEGTSGNDSLSYWHTWSTHMPGNLKGYAGNDKLYGDHGDDILDGGTGQDYMAGSGGDDLYIVDNASDTLVEPWNGGIDTVQTTVSWTLDTDFEHLILDSSVTIDGTGNAKSNKLTGNDASNTLVGLGGDDVISGAAGDDTLKGGDGDDALNGGAGNDILIGGTGADTFIFEEGFGTDTVTDFDPNEAGEAIDLAGVSSIVDYADLTSNHLSQVGSDVVIDDLLGNTVLLQNTLIALLQDSDFIF